MMKGDNMGALAPGAASREPEPIRREFPESI
jgi:hypothetical protein